VEYPAAAIVDGQALGMINNILINAGSTFAKLDLFERNGTTTIL
jgi:hypothetical protein